MNNDTKKAIALALHLGTEHFVLDGIACNGNKASERQSYAAHIDHVGGVDCTFTEWCEQECIPLDNDDNYLVLTDEEADDMARDYIEETLWAFNPSFLAGITSIEEEVFEAIAANDRCESNNPAIRKLVGDDMERLVRDAIACDGRGHFMSTYDGKEHEVNLFDVTGVNEYLYVYRLN